jgi:zinc transport system ATP-binding protein
MAPPLLEIDSLTVRRGHALLVERAGFTVEAQAIHVLAGPNGAGKTTILRAILGQVPFEGSIRFHWRKGGRIGYVPQALDFDREMPMTVGDFLTLGRQRRPACLGTGEAVQGRIERSLRRVGMEDRSRRRLGVLSGGELQRVLLAQALDPVPELLLLDEAAAGVDEDGLQALEEALRRLKTEEGVTTLLVSHDFEHVRRVADQVTWVNRTVRKTGTPGEVLG